MPYHSYDEIFDGYQEWVERQNSQEYHREELDIKSIKEKADKYAQSQGYFPGACAAQLTMGYHCTVDGYIQGYIQALKDNDN